MRAHGLRNVADPDGPPIGRAARGRVTPPIQVEPPLDGLGAVEQPGRRRAILRVEPRYVRVSIRSTGRPRGCGHAQCNDCTQVDHRRPTVIISVSAVDPRQVVIDGRWTATGRQRPIETPRCPFLGPPCDTRYARIEMAFTETSRLASPVGRSFRGRCPVHRTQSVCMTSLRPQ